MRFRRETARSWQISVGDRESLTLALWLRDASGMSPDLDPPIPPLDPPVAVRADLAELAVPQAVAQWTGLWIGLWDERLDDWYVLSVLGPPGHELLSQSPHLRELTAAAFQEAVRWSANHRPLRAGSPSSHSAPERLPGQVVRQLEKAAGRAARPFTLDIRILPVAGRRFWLPAQGRLVVSENLARDLPAFQDLLRDVIEPMI